MIRVLSLSNFHHHLVISHENFTIQRIENRLGVSQNRANYKQQQHQLVVVLQMEKAEIYLSLIAKQYK